MKKEHGFTNKKGRDENLDTEDIRSENSLDEETEESNESAEENDASEQDASEDEVAVLKEENQKLKNEFLRALAEAENVKKRCAAEIEKNNKYAVSAFAKDLLTVADNLQRALSAGGSEASPECESILKGVSLTQDELTHVFAKFGIVPMADVGKVFDPNYHRVVQEVEDKDKPAGTIVAELQTGYMINGRILREAMVVVTKGGK